MKLFVAIYDDARLLDHFIRHYTKVGVTEFFVALDDRVRGIAKPVSSSTVTFVHGLDVADSFYGGNAAVTELRRLHQGVDEWAIIVDLDEFIEFPTPLPELIQAADRAEANIIKGTMFDRFSIDGILKDFEPDSELAELYPVKARFVYNVLDGADWKGVLVKGLLQPRIAHHEFWNESPHGEFLEISHYKWSSTAALDRVRAAYQALTERGAHWADEYRLILEHYEQYGRFAWETFGGQLTKPRTDASGAIAQRSASVRLPS